MSEQKRISLDEIMRLKAEKQKAIWTPEKEKAFDEKLKAQRERDEKWEREHPPKDEPKEEDEDEDESEEE